MRRSPTRTRTIRTRTRATWTRTRTTPTPTQTTRTSSALSRCVAPVEEERFRRDYWERAPLFVPRGEDGRFDDLLSQDEAERLVTTTAPRFPAFRLVKAGEQIPVSSYTADVRWRPQPFTAVADVRRVLAEFSRGATIVLQALHVSHAPLAAFSRLLERELGHPVQVNAYYTPRAAQGLPVHHDTHDVFVLQVAGEKRWQVYAPALELPLRSQRYDRSMGEPGDALLDVTVRAGDTLYLPRGWLHQALTSETDSLHLTLGVNVVTWLDELGWALEECADDVRFRRSSRHGSADDLLDALRERLDAATRAERRSLRLVERARPVLEDGFDQLRALPDLDLDTLVERRATAVAELEPVEDRLALRFDGSELGFPGHVADELVYVLSTNESFRPRDLPGTLDDPGRLVLVRRLVLEGLLRVV